MIETIEVIINSAEGFGQPMTIGPNDTEKGKLQSRKVEFTILKKLTT